MEHLKINRTATNNKQAHSDTKVRKEQNTKGIKRRVMKNKD